MTLVRWKPFTDLFNLYDRHNQLFFDELYREKDKQDVFSSWTPSADVYETKDEYVFKIELPGISKEDLNIDFDQNTLTIKGERKEEKEIKDENYHRTERCCGSFSRSFNIPQNVDHKKIDASMKDGILEIKIPKIEEQKAKSIPIKIK